MNVSPWFAVNRFAAKLFGTATMNRHDPFARETSRLTGTQARVGVPQFGTKGAQCRSAVSLELGRDSAAT